MVHCCQKLESPVHWTTASLGRATSIRGCTSRLEQLLIKRLKGPPGRCLIIRTHIGMVARGEMNQEQHRQRNRACYKHMVREACLPDHPVASCSSRRGRRGPRTWPAPCQAARGARTAALPCGVRPSTTRSAHLHRSMEVGIPHAACSGHGAEPLRFCMLHCARHLRL